MQDPSEGDNQTSHTIVQTLDVYLSSSDIDAHAAAERLAGLSDESAFEEILRRARSISYDDPEQEKLVQLLSAKGSWKSLDSLGISVRELWNGSVDENGVDGWASLNAFVARLAQAEVSNFDDYGIWSMRSALEDFTFEDRNAVTGKVKEGELNPDILDQHVPAAAVWAIYAGKRMLELSKESKEGSASTRGGPSWEGKPGYSMERWDFWKQKFATFSVREDLAAKTKELSAKAYESMKAL
jgi:hypothetical protein